MSIIRAQTMSVVLASALCSTSWAALSAYPAEAAEAPRQESRPEAKADTKPDPGNLKPFADIIKGAQRQEGLFPIWQKDDKVWLEIPPAMLGSPFFFEVNRSHGMGERGVYASQMEESHMASFRRLGDRIQLVAHNPRFFAAPGTPQALAVEQGFSESLLASATVLSQPHPEHQGILIDASTLLLADIPAGGHLLETAFRQNFAFDAKQSAILRARSSADLSTFQVRAHYGVGRLPVPPLYTPGNPPPPATPMPRNLPDPRSLFLGFVYSFARLPAPMASRPADGRLGHFTTTRWNFSSDQNARPREYLVNRWRLEKAEPDAPLSEPKQPIVFWLDRNIPEVYREAIREGVLAWNAAFERIGFKNAVAVRQQGVDEDFDTLEAGRASIRWFVGSDVGFAIGPSRVDPRSGEILDADIAISDVFARSSRRQFREDFPETPKALFDPHGHPLCHLDHAAAEEMHFALDLLEARGDLEPGSAEEARYVQDVIREVTMHEVGHALGLRHNFRASTVYSEAQLADKTFTARQGIAGSVMDYVPANLALHGQPQGEYRMRALGEYDHWAIEYAYKPLLPSEEATELARIAARASEPLLAFATDEDAGWFEDSFDPATSRFDLGSDPLAFFEKRVKLSRELWARLERKPLPAGEPYAALRRSVESGFAQLRWAIDIGVKYLGGLSHLRDHAGSGRAPLTPLDDASQRRALHLLADSVFSPASFRFAPDFLRRLPPDHLDRLETGQKLDIDLNDRILALQQRVLDKLFRDNVAARVLDNDHKRDNASRQDTLPKQSPSKNQNKLQHPAASQPFRLSELYDTLQALIWQEAVQGGEPETGRRALQREHLKQMVRLLTRPGAQTPADAIALNRENARELVATLDKALRQPRLGKETRAHYQEARSTLNEALRASFNRTGV